MEHENLDQEKSSWGGSRAGAGRPQGATNKIPKQVKEKVLRRNFDELGGLEEMVNWAYLKLTLRAPDRVLQVLQ
jgi:hypothetical protein